MRISKFSGHLASDSTSANLQNRKYQALTPKTKAIIGVGVMGYALAGLYLSDTAEERFDMVPTEQDREKLRQMIPKIHAVDKDESPIARGR